ncbi:MULTISPECIES: PTS sugar transporter subunit IIA [Corynebacterium]|jgi:probable PTS family porter protein|uniref:PTS sugar transporter subunit IIA n=1 Tax=Corynebacterium TaxID=1716 RepID=UPI001EF7069E|nr:MULTISPECIES: PTS sugar transporter subunit IIA [Corynebacterium]MCG7243760.1 PTS sugar transporter subunit IIA [Corynebacterium sp. ACRPS]MCG7272552.1 PTS sugar transporter subunit IIA [Corynebacterium sp. ACRQM]MCG7234755.1 PTS sugar transporter subunit IIA [Corynebacterium sp. ACRPR]MDK8474884.1 PTS sugar transporter subunit IIA [Corynebacterium sp. MSK078]MDK8660077.1 PTS sugar transporter subunit IIA [Corynebacterium sp. MSK204]
MVTLDSLLVPGAVEIHGTAKDWRAAIRLAGSLLEEAGTITADYTEAMVQSVEETGPYIVVSPGFAFAHARPSEAVKETSLSWVHLDKPVEFGHDSNDPVDLVVAFAARSDSEHLQAMKQLAKLLATKRDELNRAESEKELRAILTASTSSKKRTTSAAPAESTARPAKQTAADSVASKGKILTVCGNGLGTSLFLKNTLEQVLDEWGWGSYLTVEATDTISAKGRASEADFLLTSGEIAATLGDVGVPVYVIQNFTSTSELDAALRELYDI